MICMTEKGNQILQDALQLDVAERARVAAELLASLDELEDEVERAWATEIARRVAETRADASDEEDWRAAFEEIQKKVLTR